MATLQLKDINKIYPNGVQAVFDFNLSIKDKEFIVFVFRKFRVMNLYMRVLVFNGILNKCINNAIGKTQHK